MLYRPVSADRVYTGMGAGSGVGSPMEYARGKARQEQKYRLAHEER